MWEGPNFCANGSLSLMVTTLGGLILINLSEERSKETVETYVYNLEVYSNILRIFYK